MSEAIAWITAHWLHVLIGGLVAVQIINRITARWDELDGDSWRKVLLLYTEIASVVVSRGRVGAWKYFKLPLSPFGGKSSAGPSSPATIGLIMICALVCGAGCASFSSKANQSITVAHDTAQGVWETARTILHHRAMETLSHCESAGDLQCDGYQKTRKLRRDLATALQATSEMLARAREALIIYQSMVDRDAPQAQIKAQQAVVHERINRANRQNAAFIKRLQAEGLTHDAPPTYRGDRAAIRNGTTQVAGRVTATGSGDQSGGDPVPES